MPDDIKSPEEQAAEKAANEAALAKAEGREPEQVDPTDGKPDGLAGFETPEELAKAYTELRTKMSKDGAPKADETPDTNADDAAKATAEAEKAAEDAGFKLADLQNEFTEKGELSAETYEKLEKAGFNKATVDGYIAGQQALAEQYQSRIEAHVGGADALNDMIEWAAQNLSQEEKVAFNSTVDAGDEAALKLALDGLKAKFTSSNGDEPKLLGGENKGASSSVFRSTSELTEAMRDPRYAKDEAYRKDVEERLARSSIF